MVSTRSGAGRRSSRSPRRAAASEDAGPAALAVVPDSSGEDSESSSGSCGEVGDVTAAGGGVELNGVVNVDSESDEDSDEAEGSEEVEEVEEVEESDVGDGSDEAEDLQGVEEAGGVVDGEKEASGDELFTAAGGDDKYPLDSFLAKSASKPQLFMTRSHALTNACRGLMKHLYDGQSLFEESVSKTPAAAPDAPKRRKKRARSHAALGPLPHIEVGDVFETDQVWEELLLRNRPMGGYLERVVRNEDKMDAKRLKRLEAVDAEESDAESGGKPDSGSAETAGFVADEGAGLLANGELAAGGSDSEADQQGVSEDEPVAEPVQKKVRFSVDAGDKDESGSDLETGSASNVEDGFFSFADMEAFGDEAEELALDGKLMADGEDEGGANSESGEDDSDEGGSDGEAGLTLGRKLKASSQRTGDRVRYEDFFDRPGSEASGEANLDPDAERALRRANMFDTGDSSDSDDEDGGPKTALEVERAKLRGNISALEHASVSKKPWQLRGEVDAHGRPLNSLIESEFEHDIVARPRGAPSADASASIEDIIRQRIFDGLFDDVVRKLPADYESAKNKNQRKPPAEISQEKPEEGLAEIYEREFTEEREKVSKAAEAASSITVREADPEESPEQAEVNKLFKRLSNKIDALSSLHFTPAPPKMPTEMEVKLNVPALNAEEAIPEAVSDATLLSAREVHAADKKDLQGDVETDKVERRKKRRDKKRRISSANKEQLAVEKEAELGDPDRAAHLRAQRTLQRPGKLLKPVKTPGDKSKKKNRQSKDQNIDGLLAKSGDFSKSTRFFSQLQETTRKDLAGKNSDLLASGTAGPSAGKLKL